MSSVAQAPPRVLWIKGRPYEVHPLDPGEDGTAAFRLGKSDGTCYDVIREHDGILRCDCPHYELRLRGNTRTPCKHGLALIDAGLVPDVGTDPLVAELVDDGRAPGEPDPGADGDGGSWDEWADDRIAPGPAPTPMRAAIDYLEARAARLYRLDNELADLTGVWLDRLARAIRDTGATRLGDVLPRLDALAETGRAAIDDLRRAEARLAEAEAMLEGRR